MSAALERLRQEIAEQPAVVAEILDRQWPTVVQVASAIRQRGERTIVLVARGSSDNAAIYGRYLLEIVNRRATSLAAPSTLTLYGSGPRLAETVVVGVSQSGRGEDVVSYLQAARAQGALTLAVVNDVASPLAQAAEWVLDCAAGPEYSVPATKSVTAQMTLLAALSLALAGAEKPAELVGLPDAIAAALSRREAIQDMAARLAASADLSIAAAVIGRGFAYPVALELALKLKETAYARAEPFSAADFRHGPIALVEPGYAAIVIDVGGRSTGPAAETAAEVRRRGGTVYLIRVGQMTQLPPDLAVAGVEVPFALQEPYAAVPAIVLGQMLAVELAVKLGYDPAQPRGLRKVTSTR